jgi:hypothetical protein
VRHRCDRRRVLVGLGVSLVGGAFSLAVLRAGESASGSGGYRAVGPTVPSTGPWTTAAAMPPTSTPESPDRPSTTNLEVPATAGDPPTTMRTPPTTIVQRVNGLSSAPTLHRVETVSAPPQQPPALGPCVTGSFSYPQDGTSGLPQVVAVHATLQSSAGPGRCKSADLPVRAVVVDWQGTRHDPGWALYCTFESCTRSDVIIGASPSDPGHTFALILTIGGRDIQTITVIRAP